MNRPSMEHPESELLSAYAEGVPLEGERRELLKSHLGECGACREEVEWIQRLRHEAGAWTLREVPPPPDLWTRIEAAISGPARTRGEADTGGMPGDGGASGDRVGRSGLRPGLRAAAALALVAVSTLLGLQLLRMGEVVPRADPGPGTGPAVASELSAAQEQVQLTAFAEELENAYGPAIRELERALAEDRGNLAPETIEILEENLRIIDQAIEDTLAALSADPGSSLGPSLLGGMFESKLQVLQQAVRLARSA